MHSYINGHQHPWCTRHDLRHTIPWSLRDDGQPGISRANTVMTSHGQSGISRANTVMNSHGDHSRTPMVGPKSADNKRSMDDRRLREVLEELYKDKKYFDHVIDSTGERIFRY